MHLLNADQYQQIKSYDRGNNIQPQHRKCNMLSIPHYTTGNFKLMKKHKPMCRSVNVQLCSDSAEHPRQHLAAMKQGQYFSLLGNDLGAYKSQCKGILNLMFCCIFLFTDCSAQSIQRYMTVLAKWQKLVSYAYKQFLLLLLSLCFC